MNRATITFLNAVWASQHCPQDCDQIYRFVSVKDWDSGSWQDFPISKNRELEAISDKNLYFAPCGFDDPRRLRRNAIAGKWLYADLDEVNPNFLPGS